MSAAPYTCSLYSIFALLSLFSSLSLSLSLDPPLYLSYLYYCSFLSLSARSLPASPISLSLLSIVPAFSLTLTPCEE